MNNKHIIKRKYNKNQINLIVKNLTNKQINNNKKEKFYRILMILEKQSFLFDTQSDRIQENPSDCYH